MVLYCECGLYIRWLDDKGLEFGFNVTWYQEESCVTLALLLSRVNYGVVLGVQYC